MTDAAVLILALALSQGLFALGWWLSGRQLGMAPQASRQWAAFSASSAAAMLCFTPEVADALGAVAVVLRNALVVVAFMLLRRGVLAFLHQPLQDREQAALLAAYLLLMAPLGTGPQQVGARTVLLSALVAWCLVRTGATLWRQGRHEYGRTVVAWVALPMLAGGALMAARAVLALVRPSASAVVVTGTSGFNVTMLVGMLVLMPVVHFALGYLVILRMVGKLQHLTRHDSLTGLANRRAFDERLRQEVATSRRTGLPLGLLMIDVDHFKRVNDRHGHPGGDAVLRQVAQRLAAAARGNDVVARLGGEEFAALLPATDAAGIRQAAERLRLAVAGAPMALEDAAPSVTVSVGASMLLAGETSGAAAQQRADQALYRAKADGRNRVVVGTLAGVEAEPQKALPDAP